MFLLVDSLFEFALCCGLIPPLDPRAAASSFGGRAVPEYGASTFVAQPRVAVLQLPLAVRCWSSMQTTPKFLPCDGCGLPASPEHIAERVRRLELSTMFRPIHMGVLFIALAPPVRLEDDFYAPAKSKEFFDPFLEALEIPISSRDTSETERNARAADSARLAEFQRGGYLLAYLAECPLPENQERASSTIARLGPTLIRRIQFNYKPKQIVILGRELSPLRDIFDKGGIPTTSVTVLEIPMAGDSEAARQFRAALVIPAQVSNASV